MRLINLPYDELNVGDSAHLKRLVTQDDLYVFAVSSGNYNPMHLADNQASPSAAVTPWSVAPGMFVASMISAVIGTQLPGPGSVYRSQTIEFIDLAHVDDELVCSVKVLEKIGHGVIRLETRVTRASDGALILKGLADVLAPMAKIDLPDVEVPGLIVQRHRHFDALLQQAKAAPLLPVAVVCPYDGNSLGGALLAAKEGLIKPLLLGDAQKIRHTAELIGAQLDDAHIMDMKENDQQVALHACSLVRQGQAGAVMKGHLHTDDLLKPMLDKTHGLRVGRRFTHVFVMDVPGLREPLMVTDAAININPDLATKVDICQNAIDLARSLSMEPRVGVLSAVETVNPAIQSSIDGALLSKMAERGQIKGGQVDGPLAMDNAVDLAAARTKGLTGSVAGQANILLVPGLDAGNMLAKQLAFVSHAEGAGLVLGAKVPVILNSRSDSPMSRLASCAVAALHHAKTGVS